MSMRDEIRAEAQAAKAPFLPVPTPELPKWDGKIGVTTASLHVIAAIWQDDDDQLDERAKFVVRVACDSEGNRIFTDEDVMWLSTSSVLAPVIERLYWAGRHICGLTEEKRAAWRKNLPGTGGDGSHSSCAEQFPPATAST
jgi:hypothetical protein